MTAGPGTATEPVYDSDAASDGALGLVGLRNHRGLVGVLLRRGLSTRYQRSVIGVGWTLIVPAMEMLVLLAIFSQVFRASSPDAPYVVYLLSGVVLSTLMRNIVSSCSAALEANTAILSRLRVPPLTFVVAAALEALLVFAVSLIPLAAVMLAVGPGLDWLSPVAVVPGVLLAILGLGVGMALAPVAARFPDVLVLTGIVLNFVSYLAPVFYPYAIVPHRYRPILQANPLVHDLDLFRALLYEHRVGDLDDWLVAVGSAAVALLVGSAVFTRTYRSMLANL